MWSPKPQTFVWGWNQQIVFHPKLNIVTTIRPLRPAAFSDAAKDLKISPPAAVPDPRTDLHTTIAMAFSRKRFVSSSDAENFAAKYRALLAKRPFLLFGLPFISIIVAGSFVLTPATAIRYEKHDRKVRQLTREEELGLKTGARKPVDMKEEYYVSPPVPCTQTSVHDMVLTSLQRLAAKDIDNWEQKRVKRFKGEHDGIIE